MDRNEREEFASAVAKGLTKAHKQEGPINPQNIFYSIGVAAVIFVSYNFSNTVENQGEKLDELTEAVSQLVTVSETQQRELKLYEDKTDSIETYVAEQARLKDQEHDNKIKMLEREVYGE